LRKQKQKFGKILEKFGKILEKFGKIFFLIYAKLNFLAKFGNFLFHFKPN